MSRGSIQLRHKKTCPAKGKDARACKCGPTVYVVIDGQWAKVGYLEPGWRARDLDAFHARLSAMRDKYANGEAWQPKKAIRLAEYAETWFDDLYTAAEAGRISKLTFNSYEGIWRNHLAAAFGALPLAAIDAQAIRRFVNAKIAGPFEEVSANAMITPLSAMLSDAEAAGLISRNPCRSPRRGRHANRTRVLAPVPDTKVRKHLEPDEARALLAATSDEYRAMVLMALTTGARRCELLALRWEDIDFANAMMRIDGQLQARRRESTRANAPCRSIAA